MTTQPTCADRIAEHREGRLANLGALNTLANVDDRDDLNEIVSDQAARDALSELQISDKDIQEAHEGEGRVFEEIREAADDARIAMVLEITTTRTFKILLSTGGPADWLAVECSGDTAQSEPEPESGGDRYEVERITYHFQDWGDHAEERLTDDAFATARAFAERVVPELIE